MELVIKLKAGTTLAQTEEMFGELTSDERYMDLIQNIRLHPGEIS